jgi:hypothetical protein
LSRNIVYLWGHNHHPGYDTNVNFVARPGDHICGVGTYNNATVCNQTLTSTYLNAGYITNGNYSVVTLSSGNIQVYRIETTSDTISAMSITTPSSTSWMR